MVISDIVSLKSGGFRGMILSEKSFVRVLALNFSFWSPSSEKNSPTKSFSSNTPKDGNSV
jgi:hypothetical protein